MIIRIQAKRPVFKPSPYETSRRRKGLPRWLVLMLLGILIGASGVLFVQTSYGPKQLSILDSQKLISDMNSVTLEKQRLQTQVDEFTQKLELERSESAQTKKALEEELSKLQGLLEPLKVQLEAFAQTLPFDPKYGSIGISMAQFTQGKTGGKLSYLVWVMQEKPDRPLFNGQLQLAFEGRHADGRNETITLNPISVKVQHYQHITGQADLPEGFVARRVNVKILDADEKKQLTWRVMQVQQK